MLGMSFEGDTPTSERCGALQTACACAGVFAE
jgi:hypothetical protein